MDLKRKRTKLVSVQRNWMHVLWGNPKKSSGDSTIGFEEVATTEVLAEMAYPGHGAEEQPVPVMVS